MEKRFVATVIAVAAFAFGCFAASFKMGGSATVTLGDSGEAEFTVTGLSKGAVYTIVSQSSGESSASLELGFYYKEKFDGETSIEEMSISSSDGDERSATTERLFVYAEDWEFAGLVKGADFDPEFDELYKASSYYLRVYGESGTTVTITSYSGIVAESIPAGCEDNKVGFGQMTDRAPTVKKNGVFCDDDDYWFTVPMTAGRQYKFTVSGDGISGSITFTASTDDMDDPPSSIPEASQDGKSVSIYVTPTQTGTYFLQIDGEYGKKFEVVGAMSATRAVTAHPVVAALADGATVDVEAGARNDPATYAKETDTFYDEIIDTSLFSVDLKAGRIALFETAFADAEDCVLEVYDSSGSIVGCNYYKSPSENGQRFSFVPSAGGTYYVGVCRKDLDLTELPTNVTREAAMGYGTLSYTDCGEYLAERDDAPLTTKSTLSFVLGAADTEGAQQFREDGSSFMLDATNRVDWFILGARKGIAYNLKTVTDEAYYMADRPLTLAVYTVNAKGEETLVENLGDASEGVEFIAPNNATYYVKASIPDGEGCECPYDLYAWVSGDEYGFLNVLVKGAKEAQWYLKGETNFKYDGGSEIILPVGEYTIQCTKVNGWTKPDDVVETVVAGNDNRKTVTLKYSDTSDPKDDEMKGAVAMAPTKAKPVAVTRSLWAPSGTYKGDAADFFKLSVVAGTQYGLKLAADEGSPIVAVYRNGKIANGDFTGEAVAEGIDVSFMAQEKGTYYAVVTRAADAADVDAAYTLTATSCNVGYVKTDKTEYKIGEKAGYLSVKFSRTSKEGRVRVRYTTVEGTAKANVHYVAQTGELEWADGDNKAQEVKIKIIPDLVDTWDEDRAFTIRIDAVDDDDFDETEEYRPLLTASEAVVTITDSSKVAPGTLQFFASGEEQEAFANASKPAFTVAAGDDAVLWISRTGGADKMVAVKATVTAKQTAGEEYVVVDEQEVWWDDGDEGDKELRIPTMRPTDAYFAAKTFTVKITALAGDAKATVKNGSATVTVIDGDSPMTFAEYAASFPKTSGVTVKSAKADTWYFDASGALRSVMPAKKGDKAELTFSVTGPGRLRFSPDFVLDGDDTTCTVMVGKNALTSTLDGTQADLFLGTGKVDVKITVVRGASADSYTDSYLALYPQDDGAPFLWEPLPMPTLVSPASDKALVNPEHAILRWACSDNANVRYAFYCDTDKKKIGGPSAMISPNYLIDMTTYEICTACGDDPLQGNTAYSWRVDSVMLDDDGEVRLVNTNKTVWTFKTAANDAPVATIASATDLTGVDVAELVAAGEPITAVQGVSVTNLVFGSETPGVTWALVSGAKLPQGLSIDKNTGAIVGIPQKAGDFPAAVQATSGRIVGSAVAFTLRVLPIELAAGTFNGLVNAEESEFSDVAGLANSANGSLSVTVKDTGAISANVVAGDTKFAFKANGYDGLVDLANGQPGVSATMFSTVKLLNVTYTNTLTITACRAGTNDWAAIDTPLSAAMTLNFLSPDKKSVVTEVAYTGVALRDNTKFPAVVAEQKQYVGYYTITLPVSGGASGAPQGNGYVTLTLDAKGKAKIAGVLADGTALSGSAVIGYISDDDEGKSAVYLPVFMAKKGVSVGGWVRLFLSDAATFGGQDISAGAPLPVADGESRLSWINADAHAAYDGEKWSSYSVELSPVGGYYSTVVNLQSYYRNCSLYLADLLDGEQLPEALRGEGYEWAAYPGMIADQSSGAQHGLYVDMVVNAPTVEKTTVVNTLDEKGKKTKLIDWAASANPCKFTMTFKQATGIFNGSFDLYAAKFDEAGSETEQKKVGSFKHQGVLVMTRDESAPLAAEDGVMSGFYTAPVKAVDPNDKKSYNWTASYMMLIGAEEIVNPPTEGWDSEEP